MGKFFNKNKYDLVLGITESSKSPLFNMVEKRSDGSLKKIIDRGQNITRRQDSKTYFDITTVCYISSPKYIIETTSIFDGNIGGFSIPRERSLDIDSPYDMDIANYLIKKNDN
jgi:N-acylneuraminate cytidylyltransferase